MQISLTAFRKQTYFLAPMAGFSHLPFRRLCHKGQCDFNTTELVSARGIIYNGLEPSWRYLLIDPESEGPVAIQLFGSEPDDFVRACDKIMADPILKQCTTIDINMGCPVKKVCQTGAGAALMLTEERACAIVKALKIYLAGSGVFVTAKFRKGYYSEDNTAKDFALHLAEAGADRLVLHARTAKQMYSGHADWALFADVKQALVEHGFGDIPFIANGDIKSQADCDEIRKIANVDGFMIGRAACGDPWIFQMLKTGQAEISPSERCLALRQCFEDMCEILGEHIACHEFRGLIMPWLKARPQSSNLRQICGKMQTKSEWLELFTKLPDFFATTLTK